jgi:myosin heavy subunit
VLQKMWRGVAARKQFREAVRRRDEVRRHAAVGIQKTWRAFRVRRDFRATLAKIIKVQAVVRMNQVKRAYENFCCCCSIILSINIHNPMPSFLNGKTNGVY